MFLKFLQTTPHHIRNILPNLKAHIQDKYNKNTKF